MASDGEVYLKIGDVARLVGISPSAIRAWEALGLTRPQRTESRYRLYTQDDVRLLKKARYLRKVRGLNAAAIVQTLKREGAIQPSAEWRLCRDWPAIAPLAHPARRRPRQGRGRRGNFGWLLERA